MTDVLIKNWCIPKCCMDCDPDFAYAIKCEAYNENNDFTRQRAENCPLVEIKHSQDGDLISRADAIEAVYRLVKELPPKPILSKEPNKIYPSDVVKALSALPSADMRHKEDKTDRSNPRLKELDKLEKYLVRKGISYDRFDEAGRIVEETGVMLKGNKHQIYVPKRGEDCEWAVICQNGSEGYEDGRIELYGDLVDVDEVGDTVIGFLTADDVIRRLEERPYKGGA